MKGIVFSEFNDMVEETFSPEILDRIIEKAALPSGGAYTSVGTYDHVELVSLVTHLSEETGIDAGELVRAFGKHLAGRFATQYPAFFNGVDGTLDFLETIEAHVHVEVRKLYPDAELPIFDTRRHDRDHLQMTYRSNRPFADLAEGLILGCAEHFNENLKISREDNQHNGINESRFAIQQQN
ncbi:MAG: heme NO-binding domain-containing protein [Gammaproteobacteria bacterium]|nr:heme NO-binding domain-containing protein [Gammaproteobacteria bacterium]